MKQSQKRAETMNTVCAEQIRHNITTSQIPRLYYNQLEYVQRVSQITLKPYK